MHRSGVILCCWPWKLLERSGSSSLGGPEKVATVKVTSILLCPTPPRPPPSLTLSLSLSSSSPSSPRVSTNTLTFAHAHNKVQRVPAATRASNLNSPAVSPSARALAPRSRPVTFRTKTKSGSETWILQSLLHSNDSHPIRLTRI